MSSTIKILSIDGGGIRGILPAMLLAELERRTGKRTAEMFDLISGTSTGGIITLGLTMPDEQGKPQHQAEAILELYEKQGRDIFSRTIWQRLQTLESIIGSKYPSDGLERILESYFNGVRLSQVITDVFLTSYDLERHEPYFFSSYQAHRNPERDLLLRHVARATSAAPTYFDPAQVQFPGEDVPRTLVDGGLVANNPALSAFIEAREIYPKADSYILISIGTGDVLRPMPHEQAMNWGMMQWAQQLFDVVVTAADRTIDYQLRRLLPVCVDGQQHYYRFQVPLQGDDVSDQMDDISDKNIRGLKRLGKQLIDENDQKLNRIADLLTTPPKRRWFPFRIVGNQSGQQAIG